MIHKHSERVTENKSNVRGGWGRLLFRHLFTEEELNGRATMLTTVTLRPGESIGTHSHEDNAEVYYILKGSAMVMDDGVEVEMRPGDCQLCAEGHSHAIRNHTSGNTTFLALVLPDR